MEPTRRFWEALGVAAALCVAAVTFDRPLLLLGPAGVAAWLLASQLGFVYAVGRLDDSLSVAQTLDREAAVTDASVGATLTATGDDAGLRTVVTARPSAGLTAEGDLEAALGDAAAFALESGIAGTHRLEEPEIEVRDPAGLFVERFARGEERELIVESRRPQDVHVGEGGRALPRAFGDHALDTTGTGLAPAELREYVAGEPASRIDWKATARLATPYVREFEAESDQTTLLVVDARSGLRVGPPGETAFEYLRAAALTHVTVAEYLGDPIGCFAVDDEGVRRLVTPTNTTRGYERVRRRLRELTASTAPSRTRLAPPVHRRATTFDPTTRFGRLLRAYADARPTTDSGTDPLQAAIRTAVVNAPGTLRVVLFTDDTDRAGVGEAVSEARRGEHRLEVFLAPRVLFERDTLADLTEATERYREFESFRRDLVAIDYVSAYEIAPRSRIEAVLERRREMEATGR